MTYQALARDIMYRANHALTPPNTGYMNEVTKGLNTADYGKKDYFSRINDLFRKEDPLNKSKELYQKPNFDQNILYQAALNPGKN